VAEARWLWSRLRTAKPLQWRCRVRAARIRRHSTRAAAPLQAVCILTAEAREARNLVRCCLPLTAACIRVAPIRWAVYLKLYFALSNAVAFTNICDLR